MQKKGLSTIIVTLILIVISLVAVAIFWIVVRNVLQTGTEGIGLGRYTLSGNIKNVNLDNSTNNVSLTVERNPGQGEINGIEFIFSDGTDSEVVKETISMKELESRKFYFHLTKLNVSNLISISIAFLIKENDKETLGDIVDKYNVGEGGGGGTTGGGTCSPASCTSLGYECGNWNNGSCSGTLNCGTCGTGQTCNANGICQTGSCSPITCSALGYNCGNGYANGTCAGTLNCGSCSGGQSCVDGTCQTPACTPKTSCTTGQCGSWLNGTCSGTLNCGSCSGGQTCNASGMCVGCTPGVNPCGTAVCGSVANGTCGQISCGTCGTGSSCVSGVCVADVTGNYYYVRQGATGTNNGSDWTNAYTTLPATLQRGATYYIGDGIYGSYAFNDAVSGTQYITIKKAISSDHGTGLGWQASYGDGQAEFSTTTADVWTVTSNYWNFDGQVGSGESGHGFKLSSTSTNTSNKLFRVSGTHSYIDISHTEFACPGEDHEGMGQDGYYSADSGSSNLGISYCFFHDVTRNFITISSASNVMIEYSVFARRHTTNNNPHGQGIQLGGGVVSNVTVRYSVHYDQYSTAFICALDNIHSNIYVYGNIFYINDNSRYLVSNGVFSGTSGDTLNNCVFHDNTMYNLKGSSNPGIDAVNGANNYAYNNIWYDNNNVGTWRGFTHDYNAFYSSGTQSEANRQDLTSNPFTDLTGRNFHLTTPTNAGTTLPAPYNTDLDGITRGADGTWDRGAYEYH